MVLQTRAGLLFYFNIYLNIYHGMFFSKFQKKFPRFSLKNEKITRHLHNHKLKNFNVPKSWIDETPRLILVIVIGPTTMILLISLLGLVQSLMFFICVIHFYMFFYQIFFLYFLYWKIFSYKDNLSRILFIIY